MFRTKLLFSILLATLLLHAAPTHAAAPARARITKIIVGTTGDVYVYVADNFLTGTDHGVCSRRDRYILPASHAAYNAVYAQILTSFAGDHYVNMYVNDANVCAGRDSPVMLSMVTHGH